MKIVQIVENLKCGGMENLVADLSIALQKRGVVVDIVCLKEKGELAKKAERSGVRVMALEKKEGFSLKTLFSCLDLARKGRYDIIHTHNPTAMIYGNIAGVVSRIPTVNTRHGRTAYSKLPAFFWNINSKIITISQDAKSELLRVNRIPEDKVSVILNGTDLSGFPAVSDQGVGTARIGIVARLASEKDIATLIRAFKIVVHERPETELVIVGDGADRKMLEDLAEGSNVKFFGFREDIPAIVSTFDVFVLSSLTEGISLTLLEAMAASKPIVATRVGGNPEVVVDGEIGFLVPPKDPQAMAEKILEVLRDPALAQKMGQAGRKRVEQQFSLKRMVEEYEKVYREVLESHKTQHWSFSAAPGTVDQEKGRF